MAKQPVWDLASGWDNGNAMACSVWAMNLMGIAKWTPRPVFLSYVLFPEVLATRWFAATVSGSTDVVAYASTFTSGQAGVVLVNAAIRHRW